MNIKRKISTVMLLATLALGSLPAGAVSYDSHWYAYRYNGKGTTVIELPPKANHFCYLSMVEVDNTDTENETASCRVKRGNYVWLLLATLGKSSDADVYCRAICYNN